MTAFPRARSGLTLLETLLAITILAMIVVAWHASLTGATSMGSAAERAAQIGLRAELSILADRLIDQPSEFGLDDVPMESVTVSWPRSLVDELDRGASPSERRRRAGRPAVVVAVLGNSEVRTARRWLLFSSGGVEVLRCAWGEARSTSGASSQAQPRRRRGQSGARRHGVTLLELLLAIAILAATVGAAASLVSATGSALRSAEGRATSTAIVEGIVRLIERDLAVGDTDLALDRTEEATDRTHSPRVDTLGDGTLRIRTRSAFGGKGGPVTHEYRFERSSGRLLLRFRSAEGGTEVGERVVAEGLAEFRARIDERLPLLELHLRLTERSTDDVTVRVRIP